MNGGTVKHSVGYNNHVHNRSSFYSCWKYCLHNTWACNFLLQKFCMYILRTACCSLEDYDDGYPYLSVKFLIYVLTKWMTSQARGDGGSGEDSSS